MTEPSPLILTAQKGVTVVGFREPNLLDAYHVNDTATYLYRLIEQDDCRRLVVDLSAVRMLSSQSLGVFLNMRQKLDKIQGKMALSGIDPSLSRVFKITRLQDVFKFFGDVTEAVEYLVSQ